MDYDINSLINKPDSSFTTEETCFLLNSINKDLNEKGNQIWSKLIIKATKLIILNKGCSEFYQYPYNSYKYYKTDYPSHYLIRSNILKNLCVMYLSIKDINMAHTLINEYLFMLIAYASKTNTHTGTHYFSFRSFSEYSLKDINEEKISLAHPREFNDPLDTIFAYWIDHKIKNCSKDNDFYFLLKKAANHIKLRCFIACENTDNKGNTVTRRIEDLSVLMWSHYANSHKGFCIEYEFEKDMLTNSYKLDKPLFFFKDISYTKELPIADNLDIGKTIFTKSDDWSYEKETRLLQYNINNDSEFPTIPCTKAIKAIYLGLRCSDENRRKMEVAIGDKNIPLYQMVIDEDNLTRFKPIRIG